MAVVVVVAVAVVALLLVLVTVVIAVEVVLIILVLSAPTCLTLKILPSAHRLCVHGIYLTTKNNHFPEIACRLVLITET
jgi:hypothetical protein